MGIRINQNIAAMNAYRNLSVTEGQMSKSLERLSSGFRINRAADDAAGLAISEKLRGQVKGLNQAVSNAQNGISLIQTAEGALNESHSIVQRMRELAVQSANDTNTDADRAQIQKEVNELSEELSRIASTTEFNTKKLLDGSFTGAKFQIGANEGQNLSVDIGEMSAGALGVVGGVKYDATAVAAAADLRAGTYNVQANGDGTHRLVDSDGNTAATSTDGGTTYTTVATGATITFNGAVSSGTVVADGTNAAGTATATKTGTTNLDTGTYTVDAAGTGLVDSTGKAVEGWTVTSGATSTIRHTASGAEYTVGQATNAGDTFTVDGADVSSQASASATIGVLDGALEKISDQRATLGAVQNRLDHTINNLSVAAENLAASESRIRDTDMAAEMMSFTRAQILSQAGTAMLAQANQVPQGVLQLLR